MTKGELWMGHPEPGLAPLDAHLNDDKAVVKMGHPLTLCHSRRESASVLG
jgi:hypothetical protein